MTTNFGAAAEDYARFRAGFPDSLFDRLAAPHLQAAGFSKVETFSYDLDIPYTAEGWRGRIRASAGIGASLAPAEIEAFDAEHARLLDGSFPGDLLEIPHRVFTIVATRVRAG
jgi:hypothetical protein